MNRPFPQSTAAGSSTGRSDVVVAPTPQQDILAPHPTRHKVRPETPLDFFQTMHRRVRSSIDVDRPFEHAKGVPLGIPDRPDPPPTPSSPSSPSSRLQTVYPSSIPSTPARRLGTLREATRTKLASFSGGFSRDKQGKNRTAAMTKARPGLSARSSSLATSLTAHLDPAGPPTPGLTDDGSTAGSGISSWIPLSSEVVGEILSPFSTATYPPSVISTESSASHSKRERVMGLRPDLPEPASTLGDSAFVPQKKSDVLPFLDNNMFSDWEVEDAKTTRRPSTTLERMSGAQRSVGESKGQEGNFNSHPAEEAVGWRTNVKGKRVWGADVGGMYKVGWEREVLDVEARVHEAMWEVKQCHTFTSFAAGEEPQAVLDIGTGLGLWPISQAILWPQTTFVGLDLVPCQTDSDVLTRAERNARSSSDGSAKGQGMWEKIEKRVQWDQGDFLKRLPYDTSVFDMVHIRFCGLGVPESKWYDLLEESARVLKKGGTLEIVEMAYILPDSVLASIQNCFSSLLLADLVQPNTILPIRFSIPTCPALEPTIKPVWEGTWRDRVLGEAMVSWVRSALDYKGIGMKKGSGGDKILRELSQIDKKWGTTIGQEEGEHQVTVWAWVVRRL